MRSFLTVLGIIIGVAAVIVLVSLVNGYIGNVVESFAGVGVNQTNVNVTNLTSRSLDVDEMYAFYEDNTDLSIQLGPNVSLSTTVKRGTGEVDSTSVGDYSEQYLDLKEYTVEAGRNVPYADVMSRQKVCVIGAFVTQELYGSAQSALDQTIKIGGYSFKIMGVVVQKEDDMDDGSTDDLVRLPYSVAVRMSRNAVINSYTFTSVDTGLSDDYVTAIEDFLYETLKDDDLYRVTTMSEMLDSLNEQIAMVSAMLGGIAGISLLVVGMGVTNIMLISVTEHIREIGIRKSLGANEGTVMRQFVIEAAVTNSLGGVVGILIGCIFTILVETAVGIMVTPTPVAITISFSVSVGIGLLFGYMPASRAANLSPIDALRGEWRDVGVQNKTGGETGSGHRQGISGKPSVQTDQYKEGYHIDQGKCGGRHPVIP